MASMNYKESLLGDAGTTTTATPQLAVPDSAEYTTRDRLESEIGGMTVIDDIVVVSDSRTIAYRLCNYNPHDVNQKTVIYFPGAGFGRTHSPFVGKEGHKLLSTLNVAFITIERPGYGTSTLVSEQKRTLRSYADDIHWICSKHFNFIKPVYFMAHSAGVPHLLAVAYFYPQLIQQMAVVCPPNPLHGTIPADRPRETGARSMQRCCLLNCFCCLLCCIKPMVHKWKSDPAEFTKFSKQNFGKLPKEKEFFDANPAFLDRQENDFSYAVCENEHGDQALLQDMFAVNRREWGFKVRDINNINKIFVWYGTRDQVTPNGEWYCNILKNSVQRKCDGYGHALLFVKNEQILTDLVSYH